MHKGKYAITCELKYIEICSTKYARNMHKYAYEKYAIYVHNKPKICITMHFICRYMCYMLQYA